MTVRYTAREAEITARWEVGTRNLAIPCAWAVITVVSLIIAVKVFFHLPIPLASLLAQVGAAGVAILAASYAEHRINVTAGDIGKRTFILTAVDDCLLLEEGRRTLYRFTADEVTKMWVGESCVRFLTRYTAVCLPLRVCGEFADAARKHGAQIIDTGWM